MARRNATESVFGKAAFPLALCLVSPKGKSCLAFVSSPENHDSVKVVARLDVGQPFARGRDEMDRDAIVFMRNGKQIALSAEATYLAASNKLFGLSLIADHLK